MANGITQGIEDILGIDTTAGTAQLQQALAALQAVNVPNIAQLTLPELQQYVKAGVLSPQQYQAISADPQTYQTLADQADQTGTNAQKAALQQLGGIVSAGGSTPINRANLLNNINTTNQAMQAARSGIMEDAQQRGVAGGGLEFMNKLTNEQNNAQTANTGAVNAAANNAQLALQAMTQQGTLGGTLQSQANQAAQAKAEAARQIAEYNSQLQSAANQYNASTANTAQATNLTNAQNLANQNTELANTRTMYNAQLPETVYNNQIEKAKDVAGAYGQEATLAEEQAKQQSGFTGNLIGAAGILGAAAMAAAHGGEVPNMCKGGTCYAKGGEVHDHSICMKIGGMVPGQATVPGDSTQNDTIPAKLSPHEIVLPRTVAQAPNAPQRAAQFVGAIKGQSAPVSFKDVLAKLEENGLELRLAAKGV